MDTNQVTVGEFIRIAEWMVEGMVIGIRPAMLGSDDAIEVLVEVDIDDPNPRWYRLEPGAYEVV